ncbi:MoaD/ThiS family protein [Moorellaceae bacterium AZ2]
MGRRISSEPEVDEVRTMGDFIKIVFSSPFQEIIGGKNLELATQEPLTVEEVLDRLVRQFPALKKFVPQVKDEVIFWGNIVPMKEDSILKPNTLVRPGETIYLYPPLSGG